MLDQYANAAPSFDQLLVVLLPYTSGPLPREVVDLAQTLAELDALVIRPQPGALPWPNRAPRMDQAFLTGLRIALCECIEAKFPAPLPDAANVEIACDLLRGLASHTKMGPNNHSHEDDMWKARGGQLGPGGRDHIVHWLLREGIIARKKNNSAGGTGWVYWIADVVKAERLCPKLAPYFQ